jgi:hypothetical protein
MGLRKNIDDMLTSGKITKEQHEKVAGIFFGGGKGSLASNILQAAAAAAIVGTAGTQAVKTISQKIGEAQGFNKMLEKNPDLNEQPETLLRDYYDVIKTFSPKSAANPLVSGALVNKMIQFGGVDHKIVQDLSSIEGPAQNFFYDTAKVGMGAGLKEAMVG